MTSRRWTLRASWWVLRPGRHPEAAVRLGTEALRAGIGRDERTVDGCLLRLATMASTAEPGSADTVAMEKAAMIWLLTAEMAIIGDVGQGPPPGATVRPVIVNDKGEMRDMDTAPPSFKWAASLIANFLASNDEAVISILHEEHRNLERYYALLELVSSVARTSGVKVTKRLDIKVRHFSRR